MEVAKFLDALRADRRYRDQIAAVHVVPARGARTAALTPPPPPPLAQALAGAGIDRLYSHQVAACDHARAGRDQVIVTGTASGKSLCYTIPIIERILSDRRARALCLFPLKALARDQQRKLGELGLWRLVRSGTYDGDTSVDERRSVRNLAHIVFSNPDMVHLGLLPNHTLWAEFLSNLQFVVIDEVHLYRGVFGSHVAHVLRRLLRLCERYGSRPTFICCSATVGNPAELAGALTGRPDLAVVAESGAPTGARHIVVWNPPLADAATGLRRSGNIEATWLLRDLVLRGAQTLAFARARQEAELVLRYLRAALEAEAGPELADRVAAYRAGYLASERQRIEQDLAAGRLRAVVSTVALEAGIDIGGLDATVLIGYPGTIAGFWQQAGRAGRGQRDSLALLVCREGPVDQFYARHPERLWETPTEVALIDPTNVYILGSHLLCAAHELPLEPADLAPWQPTAGLLLSIFEEEGWVRQSGERWFHLGAGSPAADVSLRSAANGQYALCDQSSGATLGHEDDLRIWDACYPGAIHLHQGEQYEVMGLDEAEREIRLRQVKVDYFTQPLIQFEVTIDREVAAHGLGEVTVGCGEVSVSKTTTGYRSRKLRSQELIEEQTLDCPTRTAETLGFWLRLSAELTARLTSLGAEPQGGLHAVEHALAACLPTVALCDRRDVQGATTGHHHQLHEPVAFLFDDYPGGIGLTEVGYERIEELLAAAHDLVAGCGCAAGCPSCIQSQYCGSANQALDKAAALIILQAATGRR